jgi:hypothetical protein
MNRSRAKALTRPTPRGLALASVALFGVALQITWLVFLAQGAAAVTNWLF